MKFVTIVPHIENLELKKDTGQIPYMLHKHYGYQSTLVSYYYSLKGGRKAGPTRRVPRNEKEIEENYPYLKSITPGLNLVFLDYEGRGKFYERAILKYILRSHKNIDVLNLFHFTSENVFYALVYKLLRPTGRVYIKLDIDIAFYQQLPSIFNINGKFSKIKTWFYNKVLLRKFFKLVTCISAESHMGLQYFSERFPESKKKLLLLPNGVDVSSLYQLEQPLEYPSKENIILSVGRIGAPQKNHLLLLRALEELDLANWKVMLAGPISDGFDEYFTKWTARNPKHNGKVLLLGNVQDPKELYHFYNRTKVFCLPSRWEGYPLAAVEAAAYNCCLLLSDAIFAAPTLTDNFKGGITFENEDVTSLNVRLKELLENDNAIAEMSEHFRSHFMSMFHWPNLLKGLTARLHG